MHDVPDDFHPGDINRQVLYEDIWEDAARDAELDGAQDWLEHEIEQAFQARSETAVRTYLGTNGDAVMDRVLRAQADSQALIGHRIYGPAVISAISAVEILINHLIIRPLVQGILFADELADELADRIVGSSSEQSRTILPAFLKGYGLDEDPAMDTAATAGLGTDCGTFVPMRNRVAHDGDAVTAQEATDALTDSVTWTTAVTTALGNRTELDYPTSTWADAYRVRVGTTITQSDPIAEAQQRRRRRRRRP